jgi:hypothetical protein
MNLGRRWVLQQQANRAISLIIEELAERARLLAAASIAEAAKVAACVVQPFP